MKPTLKTALALRAEGLACIPVGANKVPTIGSWREFMETLPSREQLEVWYANGAGIAVVAGAVLCVDVDEKYRVGLMVEFEDRVRRSGLSSVWDKCLIQSTPSGGYHLVFRSEGEPFRNMKLASKANNEVLIETRGKGGYFLIPPSEGYTIIQGDYEFLPVLTADEVSDLLDVARSFDERAPAEDASRHVTSHKGGSGAGLSPGDDYDQRGDFKSLMRSHGWVWTDEKHLRRPGKSRGVSASFDVIPGRFWCFSSSTEFETEKVYRPYAVYAILEHGGDFGRAIAELARQGYGEKRERKTLTEAVKDAPVAVDPKQALERAIEKKSAEEQEAEEDALLEKLAKIEFWPGDEPEDERCLYKLAGRAIAHVGNHIAIVAPVKSGKSAFVGAKLAAACCKSHTVDLLGFEPTNFEERAVIHIDTEQSRNDHHRLLTRSLRRAGVDSVPDYLLSFCMTGWEPVDIIRAIEFLAVKASQAFGGVHSIIIDGVADLVLTPNDEEEANKLERWIRNIAIKHQCCVANVIHMNPGGRGDGGKSRGHLGSQLERKAETVLFLDKESEVTMVYSTRTRRAPITKQEAPCFAWSEKDMAHVSVKSHPVRAKENQLSGKPLPFEVEDLQAVLPAFGNRVTRKNVNEIARSVGAGVATVWRRWKTYKEIQEKGKE